MEKKKIAKAMGNDIRLKKKNGRKKKVVLVQNTRTGSVHTMIEIKKNSFPSIAIQQSQV